MLLWFFLRDLAFKFACQRIRACRISCPCLAITDRDTGYCGSDALAVLQTWERIQLRKDLSQGRMMARGMQGDRDAMLQLPQVYRQVYMPLGHCRCL